MGIIWFFLIMGNAGFISSTVPRMPLAKSGPKEEHKVWWSCSTQHLSRCGGPLPNKLGWRTLLGMGDSHSYELELMALRLYGRVSGNPEFRVLEMRIKNYRASLGFRDSRSWSCKNLEDVFWVPRVRVYFLHGVPVRGRCRMQNFA